MRLRQAERACACALAVLACGRRNAITVVLDGCLQQAYARSRPGCRRLQRHVVCTCLCHVVSPVLLLMGPAKRSGCAPDGRVVDGLLHVHPDVVVCFTQMKQLVPVCCSCCFVVWQPAATLSLARPCCSHTRTFVFCMFPPPATASAPVGVCCLEWCDWSPPLRGCPASLVP